MFSRYNTRRCITITLIATLVCALPLHAEPPAGAPGMTLPGNLSVKGNTNLQGILEVNQGVTVIGNTDLMGNIFSIGHTLNSDGTQNYDTAGLEIYIKNTNTSTRLIEQVATHGSSIFKWGTKAATDLNANGILDDFDSQWMSLDNEKLTATGKLVVNGTSAPEGSLPLDLQVGGVSKFSVDKSGNVTATGHLSVAGQSVLTQAQAAATYLTSAQADLSYLQNGGTGLVMGVRVGGAIAADSIAIGQDSYASSGSVSIGQNASSNGSPVSGINSVAIGSQARASGVYAVALGLGTLAEGAESTALGHIATTRELGGVALGRGTASTQVGQVVLGSYNATSPQSNTPLPTDDLFILGNGNGIPGDIQERSNAFVIKRNGDAEINGSISVDGVIRIKQPAGGIVMGEFVNP